MFLNQFEGCMDTMNSVEEMIVNISKKMNMEDTIKSNQKQFLKEYPHLKPYARFNSMW